MRTGQIKQEIRILLINPEIEKQASRLSNAIAPLIYLYEIWIIFAIATSVTIFNYLFFGIIFFAILMSDRVINYSGLLYPKNPKMRQRIIDDLRAYLEDPKKGKTKEIIGIIDLSKRRGPVELFFRRLVGMRHDANR